MNAEQVPGVVVSVIDENGALASVPLRRDADARAQQGGRLSLALDDRLDEGAL